MNRLCWKRAAVLFMVLALALALAACAPGASSGEDGAAASGQADEGPPALDYDKMLQTLSLMMDEERYFEIIELLQQADYQELYIDAYMDRRVYSGERAPNGEPHGQGIEIRRGSEEENRYQIFVYLYKGEFDQGLPQGRGKALEGYISPVFGDESDTPQMIHTVRRYEGAFEQGTAWGVGTVTEEVWVPSLQGELDQALAQQAASDAAASAASDSRPQSTPQSTAQSRPESQPTQSGSGAETEYLNMFAADFVRSTEQFTGPFENGLAQGRFRQKKEVLYPDGVTYTSSCDKIEFEQGAAVPLPKEEYAQIPVILAPVQYVAGVGKSGPDEALEAFTWMDDYYLTWLGKSMVFEDPSTAGSESQSQSNSQIQSEPPAASETNSNTEQEATA